MEYIIRFDDIDKTDRDGNEFTYEIEIDVPEGYTKDPDNPNRLKYVQRTGTREVTVNYIDGRQDARDTDTIELVRVADDVVVDTKETEIDSTDSSGNKYKITFENVLEETKYSRSNTLLYTYKR